MQELSVVQKIVVAAPPILLAITLHEVAHGRVALHLGDPTAKSLGRLSLNPLRHIDPIGTVLVPLLLFLSTMAALGTGIIFGWAKPVPVDFSRLRNPRRDMALVASAGPVSNLLMAVLWALLLAGVLRFAGADPFGIARPLYYMSLIGVSVNVILAVLNMLPIPPLDGGRVTVGLLPRGPAMALAKVEPYGLFILVALLATGVLSRVLWPIVESIQHFILSIVMS